MMNIFILFVLFCILNVSLCSVEVTTVKSYIENACKAGKCTLDSKSEYSNPLRVNYKFVEKRLEYYCFLAQSFLDWKKYEIRLIDGKALCIITRPKSVTVVSLSCNTGSKSTILYIQNYGSDENIKTFVSNILSSHRGSLSFDSVKYIHFGLLPPQAFGLQLVKVSNNKFFYTVEKSVSVESGKRKLVTVLIICQRSIDYMKLFDSGKMSSPLSASCGSNKFKFYYIKGTNINGTLTDVLVFPSWKMRATFVFIGEQSTYLELAKAFIEKGDLVTLKYEFMGEIVGLTSNQTVHQVSVGFCDESWMNKPMTDLPQCAQKLSKYKKKLVDNTNNQSKLPSDDSEIKKSPKLSKNSLDINPNRYKSTNRLNEGDEKTFSDPISKKPELKKPEQKKPEQTPENNVTIKEVESGPIKIKSLTTNYVQIAREMQAFDHAVTYDQSNKTGNVRTVDMIHSQFTYLLGSLNMIKNLKEWNSVFLPQIIDSPIPKAVNTLEKNGLIYIFYFGDVYILVVYNQSTHIYNINIKFKNSEDCKEEVLDRIVTFVKCPFAKLSFLHLRNMNGFVQNLGLKLQDKYRRRFYENYMWGKEKDYFDSIGITNFGQTKVGEVTVYFYSTESKCVASKANEISCKPLFDNEFATGDLVIKILSYPNERNIYAVFANPNKILIREKVSFFKSCTFTRF